jgi:hypothetical protein
MAALRIGADNAAIGPDYLWELRIESVCASCRRAEALGYPGRSPPARAIPDYFFKDHKPSAIQGEARLRGLDRIIDSKDHFSRSHRADRRNGRGGAIPSPSIISRRAGPDCTHTKIAAASAT